MSETAELTTDKNKMKALEATIRQLRSDHGEEVLIDMSAGPRKIESIPTGSLALDIALGIGGIPVGRIIEIYGPESSGKTTFCYHVMAEVQKRGGVAAFVDAEHSMDPIYAGAIGVDVKKLMISQPDHGEQALQVAEVLCKSGAVDLIVIDSVASLVPKAEIEGAIGDVTVGLQARLMSQALRKLSGEANRTGTTIIFTNQLREKIGVSFGSPETQPGGRALKFYSSVRLDIRRIETLKDGGDAVGNRVRIKTVKNKVAPPFKQVEFDIIYGTGFDRPSALIDFALEDDIAMATKSGSFFTFEGADEKVQGKAKARQFLRDNPEIADRIEAKVRAVRLNFDSGEETSDEEAADAEQAA